MPRSDREVGDGPGTATATPVIVTESLSKVSPKLDLDRQFGDVPGGLRKMLLGMIHGFALLASPADS